MAKLPGCRLEFVREDDFVEYFLFPQLPDSLAARPVPDEALVGGELHQHLAGLRDQCRAIVKAEADRLHYIWHKDEFQLQIRTGSNQEQLLNDESTDTQLSTQLPPHLHGVTHYGDNNDDEWFIVHLLYQLTKAIPHSIARIIDSDGEFLMIEAALVLPKWANPNTCEQRVYIADGVMHLIQNSPSNTAKLMAVPAALSKLRQNPTLYRVSRDIEVCIQMRLCQFTETSNTMLHRQIVRLPLGVAVLLKQRPALIAPAVHAFCERDSGDQKACRTMRFFPPEQRVRTLVCFTRMLYAMVMHNNYVPDRKIGWNLSGSINSESYKEDLLGVKIACGFEILASRAKNPNDDANDPAWRMYVRSLTSKGYFRGNLEGSQEYQRLLADAKAYYKANNERFRTAPLVGHEILEMLHDIDDNVDELRDDENNLRPSDPDDWLHITAEQLDAMLTKRYGAQKLYKSDGDINAAEFTRNIAEFLEKESEYDGIHDSDDDDDDNDDDDDIDDDDDDGDDGGDDDVGGDGANEAASSGAAGAARADNFKAKVRKNLSMRRACKGNPVMGAASRTKADAQNAKDEDNHIQHLLDFVIPEFKWDSNSDMSDYEDEEDIERNFEAMANAEKHLDIDIHEYMAQMDRELAKTTIGQSFETAKRAGTAGAAEDDFDDIETFQPININVNTLKNMMDSYKSQIGGSGPATNLLSAMGVGMSAAAAASAADTKPDLTESTV